jgi:hypothetical protein
MVATRFIRHLADGRTETHEVQARPGQSTMRAGPDTEGLTPELPDRQD